MRSFLMFCLALTFSVDLAAQGAVPAAYYSSDKKKAIQLYREAQNAFVRQEYGRCFELVDAALQKDDEFVEAWLLRSEIYARSLWVEEALESLQAAEAVVLELPKFGHLDLGIAHQYYTLGQFRIAHDMCQAIIDGNYYGREKGNAKELLGKTQLAIMYMEAATTEPGSPLPEPLNGYATQYMVSTDAFENLYFTARECLVDRFQCDEDLYVAMRQDSGWAAPLPLPGKINTETNEGSASISADGTRMVLAICKPVTDRQHSRQSGCDIYESRLVDGQWTEPEKLGPAVNSQAWESQPFLSADGTQLFFVSTRACAGGYDLWRSTLTEDGEWGRAEGLCGNINTTGNEVSPFLHPNGVDFYFASSGHEGMGGYDMYRSTLQPDGTFGPAENLGYPLNGAGDQFAFSISLDGTRAYYSEAIRRPAGQGENPSALFMVDLPQQAQPTMGANYLTGTVRDAQTKEPVQAEVELRALATDKQVAHTRSAKEGGYTLIMTQGADYALYVEAEGYLLHNEHFSYQTRQEGQNRVLDVYLEPLTPGDEVVLNNIFFDLDKATLRPESRTEIKRLAQFLDRHPELRIRVTGHTDDQGTEAYNLDLSNRRAEAVYQALVALGVSQKRLSFEGKGESVPIAPNETAEGRQKNRRITFQVEQ